MNVLIIEEHNETREVLSFSLEGHLCCDCTSVSTINDAMDVLMGEQTVNLIICSDTGESVKLFKYLASTKSNIPVLLIAESLDVDVKAFPDLRVVGSIEYARISEELIPLIDKLIEQGDILLGEPRHEYCKIDILLLLEVIPLPADIFIRLSDIKFIKVFRKGGAYKEDDAKRYLEKKEIRHLYVHKKDFSVFINRLNSALDGMLKNNKHPIKELPAYSEKVHSMMLDMYNKVGFNKEIQEVAKKNVEVVLKSVSRSPKMAILLKELSKKERGFIAAHSIAVGHIACAIAQKLGWPSDTTFRKLIYAALFHDICLPTDKLAKVGNGPSWRDEVHSLETSIKEAILSHPKRAAGLANKIKELPPDVDIIIQQHHERPDGSGYPFGINSESITPLASVFIVAHDIVDYTLAQGEFTDMQAFLLSFKYPKMSTSGVFTKVLKVLEEDFDLVNAS